MYLPAHFEEHRSEVLHELVRRHPLGLLVTLGPEGLVANPLPFLLDADPAGGPGILRAHVARANPLWREARGDVQSLVVFQGPQAYVSPSHYATKAETGKVVPTWNYVTVQARGPLRAIDDAAWVHTLVSRLTERHERTRAKPWAVSDAPADFVQANLRAIVGIEIPLSALTGKWKVSQNRNAADRAGVAAGLPAEGAEAAAMADLVARGAA
jgi:transcriptional regulator